MSLYRPEGIGYDGKREHLGGGACGRLDHKQPGTLQYPVFEYFDRYDASDQTRGTTVFDRGDPDTLGKRDLCGGCVR